MLDDFRILCPIATGEHSKVKLVQDRCGKCYTAKIMYYTTESSKKLFSNLLLNELSTLRSLSGSKTIQVLGSSLEGKHREDSKTSPCVYFLSAYCSLGSFAALSKLQPSESVVRHFAAVSVQALESIHSQGFIHQNIKLENILIDSQLTAKFCGLSLAGTAVSGKYCRLNEYSAPETVSFKKTDGKKADLFALGVAIFVLVCGGPPFLRAWSGNSHFKMLQGNKNAFWTRYAVSEEFKELMEGMLREDPKERLDLARVKTHRWMKGEVNIDELEGVRRKLAHNSRLL
jgi:serine/threonine protein kinase